MIPRRQVFRDSAAARGAAYAAAKVSQSLRGLSSARADLRKRGHFGSGYSSDQYSWAYRAALAHASREGAVLDWGCGNGHFSLFLLESGFRDVHGYSFDPPELLDLLVASGDGFAFHPGSKEDPVSLPFSQGQFDSVFSIGVLEHVREFGGDEIATLTEIRRILSPGGVFVCAHFPNRWSPVEFLARRWPGKYSHQYTYREKEIKSILRASGFRLLRLEPYGILPRNIFSGELSWIGDWSVTRRILNFADRALSAVFAPFCQNFGFVALAPD